MKRIYIYTDAISRKNGGSSSIVDLANNLIEIGKEVIVYTPFGFMDKFIYKPTSVSEKLVVKVLNYNVYKYICKSAKKLILNRLLNFVSMDLMINNINNSIIIDAIELPEFFIKKLQKNGCKVIYNHAGSPNAVIKYFGMNGVKRENLNQAKIEYLEMIDRYDYILFQSPSQAKDLYNMSSWEKDKTIVLRPSASISDIKSVKEKDSVLNTSDFNIVIVGSVQERKGQHLLPKIANSLKNEIKNIKCHIVGNIVNEEYRKTIEKDIEKLNLKDKIIFHGFKSNYLEYMNSADVILQVSEEEGVSRVLREAMALGKVIISFKLDGTNDLLVDGEDSLLSPYGNLESLANNIKKVYYDKELYDRLQETALENFKHKYSKERYLEQLENLIKRIEQDDN